MWCEWWFLGFWSVYHNCLTSHTHNNTAYAKYAFNLCMSYTTSTKVLSPLKLRKIRSGQICQAGKVWPEWPAGGGRSFVDTSLKVIVRGALGTIMCFLPVEMHGTTRLCEVHQCCITVAFSSHIADVYKKAQEGKKCGNGKGGRLKRPRWPFESLLSWRTLYLCLYDY
jgi:hypothetical protein